MRWTDGSAHNSASTRSLVCWAKAGVGSVDQARDTKKKRLVALKILADEYSQDPEYRTRFTREAHAAAELQEPHIIPIHDWGEIDGSLYIDMRAGPRRHPAQTDRCRTAGSLDVPGHDVGGRRVGKRHRTTTHRKSRYTSMG